MMLNTRRLRHGCNGMSSYLFLRLNDPDGATLAVAPAAENPLSRNMGFVKMIREKIAREISGDWP
jgi:hypothetical protein